MESLPVHVPWPIARKCQWVKGRDVEGEAAVGDDFIYAASVSTRWYFPFSDGRSTGLFWNFAELERESNEETKAKIKKFVQRFGFLGGLLSRQFVTIGEESPSGLFGDIPANRRIGETLNLWRKEILTVQRLVARWRRIADMDLTALAKAVDWSTAGEVRVDGGAVASKSKRPSFFDHCEHGDLVFPAEVALIDSLNANLGKHASVSAFINEKTREKYEGSLPNGLIGVIWLQLRAAITNDKEFERCEWCSNWFEMTPMARRGNKKKYCSPSCRSSSNNKKKEARNAKSHSSS